VAKNGQMKKIVVIGAGSASFGLSTLGAILRKPELKGSELRLIDLNEEGLATITQLAEKANRAWATGFTIKSSTSREVLLKDADFIITAIAVDREKTWDMDRKLGLKYGINHYAENGGPGGFMHSARNAAQFMPIFADIKKLAPNALLLNFTNPVPRISRLAHHYYEIKTVGICHQITFGYMQVGIVLSDILGIDVPENYTFKWLDEFEHNRTYTIGKAAAEKVQIKAAGINHFSWMLSLTDKATGEDLYPLFKKRLKTHNKDFEPFSRALFNTFGLYPITGDNHALEYLPYTHNMHRKTWERYNIQMYPFDTASGLRNGMWDDIHDMISGKKPIGMLKELPSEHAEEIIAGIVSGKKIANDAVNVPNDGYITNLPANSIVEVPGFIDKTGVHGEKIGELPEAVAELCRRDIKIAEMTVDAVYHGDKNLALQVLTLDPMIDDLEVAKNMLVEFLETQKEYLPQFK
jgi:alpha-galactosidase